MEKRSNWKQTIIAFAALGAMALAGCNHQQAAATQGHAGVVPNDPQMRTAALSALRAQSGASQQQAQSARDQQRAAALATLRAQSR